MDRSAFIPGTRARDMDDLVVLDATLYFESCDVVVLFVVLLFERIAEFLDTVFDELGISAEC
jgi:hypothetical protein